MRPGDGRIAQAIGLPEQEAEVRPDASGDGPNNEGRRHEAQQAATFVCDYALIVRLVVHGCPELSMCFARNKFGRNRRRIETGKSDFLQGNLFNDFKLICPVQSSRKKHSAFAVGQISDLTPRVSPR
ncbi:hypothetical protein OZ411_17120 [Bradyrhizobium sp. Arg237L]|uniref:hypothetical protein n=1 Tax=Bradyrhizobium sp. Arg237L TaxID=3003352 RepID=UPI00249DF977|nr:hypothetical protein [Bradyrhizobium sp. Arg237L]MDI4234525.1 hypothetical protein [Bradyrhizobium sp. Arg237L]